MDLYEVKLKLYFEMAIKKHPCSSTFKLDSTNYLYKVIYSESIRKLNFNHVINLFIKNQIGVNKNLRIKEYNIYTINFFELKGELIPHLIQIEYENGEILKKWLLPTKRVLKTKHQKKSIAKFEYCSEELQQSEVPHLYYNYEADKNHFDFVNEINFSNSLNQYDFKLTTNPDYGKCIFDKKCIIFNFFGNSYTMEFFKFKKYNFYHINLIDSFSELKKAYKLFLKENSLLDIGFVMWYICPSCYYIWKTDLINW